jgi:hypothetical protein
MRRRIMERTTTRTSRPRLGVATPRYLHSFGANGRLQGRALAVARGAWVALAAFTVGLYVVGVWLDSSRPYWPCPVGVCEQFGTEEVRRALDPLHLTLSLAFGYVFALRVLFNAGYAALAALLFARRSRDPLALFVSLALLLFGTYSVETEIGALVDANSGWWLPINILRFLGVVGLAGVLVIFPDGRFVPRWGVPVAVAWALWLGGGYFFPDSPLDTGVWPAAATLVTWALFLGAFVFAQVYRYQRVSTLAQRIQTKWVIFGFAAAALGYFGGALVFAITVTPEPTVSIVTGDLIGHTLIFVGFLAIPLTIAVAMLRHHLFDVDLLIRRALIYAALAGTLAVLYEGGVLLLERVLLALTGETGLGAETVLAFVLGALAGPLHQRIERDVTRLVYPRRYAAERRIEAFARQLRREWEVTLPAEEWEDALAERLGRAFQVRGNPSRAGSYVQGRLFP